MINDLTLRIDDNNKWSLIVEDEKRKIYIVIPPRKKGVDFIDRNFRYHFDYKSCLSNGIVIIIENSLPKAFILDGKHIRLSRINECFKKNSRLIKRKGITNRKHITDICGMG